MTQTLVLLVSSFWLGAVHAATPGHGKTIAAAYIVGARGRPVDAVALGIFVTLSHTSGIVLVAVLASIGSAWLIPHRVEAYMALVTGLLVIAIGVWMLVSQRAALRASKASREVDAVAGGGHADAHRAAQEGSHGRGVQDEHGHRVEHEHSHGCGPADVCDDPNARCLAREHGSAHEHSHEHGSVHEHSGEDGSAADHPHEHGGGQHSHPHGHAQRHAKAEHGDAHNAADHGHPHDGGYHSHGWGRQHTHRIDVVAGRDRPSLPVLLGLGIAGGLLPDPGALAILLAAIASGRVVLGLFTVLVFSIGFASVLLAVGVLAARVGQIVLAWLEGRWVARIQIAAALVIVGVGAVLTAVAWRTLAQLP